MTHGSDDAVRTGVQSALDHPFFRPRDADQWTCPFGGDGVGELHKDTNSFH